jgi:hypothetical protein
MQWRRTHKQGAMKQPAPEDLSVLVERLAEARLRGLDQPASLDRSLIRRIVRQIRWLTRQAR